MNTKTQLSFCKQTLMDAKRKNVDPKAVANLTIRALVDDLELSKRHMKTAKMMINKMVKAFDTNPDHFYPKKAGGTFKEQDEAKKKKLEARQKRIKTKALEDDRKNEKESVAKKRRRKFY